MAELFILLLRIMFPFDKVGRSRELMRGLLQMVMGWVVDPRDVAGFEAYPEDRAKLEGHIAALEYNLQVLVWERAREMRGLPFIYVRRQNNPKFRRAKDMRQLFRRLSQLARNFHNLDKLAARSAARMQREHDADPLGLAAKHQPIAAALHAVACSMNPRDNGLARRSAAQAAGGCASARGCLHATGPPPLPIPNSLLPHPRSPASGITPARHMTNSPIEPGPTPDMVRPNQEAAP